MTDSLRCSEGDYFGMNNYCELIDTALILNYKTWIMLIDRTAPDISERHTLALDIGISYKEIITTFGFGTQKTSTLVYANINGTEFGEIVASVDHGNISPSAFSLNQNYPNPFNLSTEISYWLLKQAFISLKVYDVLGNEIASLVNEEKPTGKYKVDFNAAGLTSGIYFYQLKSGSFIQTKKMILMK
ncbi:MAG: T9SS type A sorting domain-containing protein [Ignavibacteriaceae bacterium]|nr:T9SS type A sorting domain-containing protein [Ignavibacteriaceae bacterium]